MLGGQRITTTATTTTPALPCPLQFTQSCCSELRTRWRHNDQTNEWEFLVPSEKQHRSIDWSHIRQLQCRSLTAAELCTFFALPLLDDTLEVITEIIHRLGEERGVRAIDAEWLTAERWLVECWQRAGI